MFFRSDVIKPYFKEDVETIDCIVLTYDASLWPLTLTSGIHLFIDDRIYDVKKYVYLVEMKNFYEWVLCVVSMGEFVLYEVSLTYYEDKCINLQFNSTDRTASYVEEYLNIELFEILDGDINPYDVCKKTLYSPLLILEFQKQFVQRNKSMKELKINYL